MAAWLIGVSRTCPFGVVLTSRSFSYITDFGISLHGLDYSASSIAEDMDNWRSPDLSGGEYVIRSPYTPDKI